MWKWNAKRCASSWFAGSLLGVTRSQVSPCSDPIPASSPDSVLLFLPLLPVVLPPSSLGESVVSLCGLATPLSPLRPANSSPLSLLLNTRLSSRNSANSFSSCSMRSLHSQLLAFPSEISDLTGEEEE